MLIDELNTALSSPSEFKRLIPTFEVFEAVFHQYITSADVLFAYVIHHTDIFQHLITNTDNLLKMALLAHVLSDPTQFQEKVIGSACKNDAAREALKYFNKTRTPLSDEIYLTPLCSQILSNTTHLYRLMFGNPECTVDNPFQKLITLLPNQAHLLMTAIQEAIVSQRLSIETDEIYDLDDLLFLFKNHPALIDEHLERLSHYPNEFCALIDNPKAFLTIWLIAKILSPTEQPCLVTTQQPYILYMKEQKYLFFASDLQFGAHAKIRLTSTFLDNDDIKILQLERERRIKNNIPLKNHTDALIKLASTKPHLFQIENPTTYRFMLDQLPLPTSKNAPKRQQN